MPTIPVHGGTRHKAQQKPPRAPLAKRRPAVGKPVVDPAPSREELELERQVDQTLSDSFPASDPPFWTLGVSSLRGGR